MSNQLISTSLFCFLFAAACTTSDGSVGGAPTASRQQAQSVFSATSTRLASALNSINNINVSVTTGINSSEACGLSGDVSLDGSYDSEDGFDLTASFVACSESEGTIDGDLHWVETTDADDTTTDEWTGTLDFTDANGTASCVFAYRSVTSDSNVSLSGTICGFDVTSELDL